MLSMFFPIVALTAILELAQGFSIAENDVAVSHFKKSIALQQQQAMDQFLPHEWKGGKVQPTAEAISTPTLFESLTSLVSAKKTKGYAVMSVYPVELCEGAPMIEYAMHVGRCFNVKVDGGKYSFVVKSTQGGWGTELKTKYYYDYDCEGQTFDSQKDEWPSSCYSASGTSYNSHHMSEKKYKDKNVLARGENLLVIGHVQEKKRCEKWKVADYMVVPLTCTFDASSNSSYKPVCSSNGGIDIALFTDGNCQVPADVTIYPIIEAGCHKVEDDDNDDDDEDDNEDDFDVYQYMKWEHLKCLQLPATTTGSLRR